MKRVLFVDDDASILDALRNLLRKQRHEWDMVFALGGEAALSELARGPFDVIVSDMRMPGMDGAALLARVREEFPSTARIVLSGHAENDAVVRALPVTHQFLNKPCDAATLRGVIERTCNLHRLLESSATRAVIGKLDRLPSPPATYRRLEAALTQKDTSARTIAGIVEQDPAMSAKILQLVNSAYFGLAHRVSSVPQAVAYLGVGVLRALALNAHVLGSVEGTIVSRATLDEVQRTSLATATIARQKIRDRKLADDAFTTGVVHEVGRLVVALGMPAQFREISEIAHATGRAPHVVEEECLGVSHAEVGAYLLGVWGLPFSIVECTALHHVPSRAGEPGELLTAMHLASAAVADVAGTTAPIDHDYLESLGRTSELADYRVAAAAYYEQLAAPQRVEPRCLELNLMETTSRVLVLCVDDEPNVLEGLSLHLHRRYQVLTAPSGAAGLETLAKHPAIAVVMSDMRMPGMDGAQFLSNARIAAPDVVRLLLTGQADMKSAIAAVNEGQILRFLTKPCPPPMLLAAFAAAVEQHRLVTAERVLLEQTLNGSIKTLVDVLALTSPGSFGRASRLKARVGELANRVNLAEKWPVEVAALLSQLGTITLPPDVLEKLTFGGDLSEAEQKMVDRLPEVNEKLLGNIPRLEPVRAILGRVARRASPGDLPSEPGDQRTVELGARILRVALDFDVLETQGMAPARAVNTLRGRGDRYDSRVLEAFAVLFGTGNTAQDEVRELPISALRVGMVFVQDVKLTTGAMLCARGYEVTESFLARARNFRPGSVKEPVRVLIPTAPPG